MLRFIIALCMAFVLIPALTIDMGGGAEGKAKAAKNAGKKASKASKKAAKKASTTAKKAGKKAAKTTKKAGKKVAKGAKKAGKAAKKGARKLKGVAQNMDVAQMVAAVKTVKSLSKGDIEGAAGHAAEGTGQGETFEAAKGAVGAAKDGDWEKAATKSAKAGAHGSGNADAYDAAEGLVDTVRTGDDEEIAQAVVSTRDANTGSGDGNDQGLPDSEEPEEIEA